MTANGNANAAREGSRDTADDSSLAALRLQHKASVRRFHCRTVSLRELVGKKIFILGYADDVTTRFGDGRTVVHCKYNLADEDSFKFITASSEIAEIMHDIDQLDAFPRSATVKTDNNRVFWME